MKTIRMVCGVMILMAFTSGISLAQEKNGGRTTERRDHGTREDMMKRMQERMNEYLKGKLEVTDEEWQAIEPLISEVNKQRFATRGRMTGRRRGGSTEADSNAVATPESELAKVLENKDAPVAEIKAKIKAVTDKRAANQAALDKAREKLREVLTLRQEAQMILAGIL